jgi:hypothetical protein
LFHHNLGAVLAFLTHESMTDVLVICLYVVAGAAAIWLAVRGGWRLHGAWKIWRAGPRGLLAARHRLWHEPSAGDLADLRYGPGGVDGVPSPPFTFSREHLTGSQPCVAVVDARGRTWRVKWGHEAKPESFAVRLAWACGYFAEVTHYVPRGRIEGCRELQRARDSVAEDGSFTGARFELEDRSVRMLFNEHSWAWNDNPFIGTPQLAGLKMVVMLLSNWDTKDRRDVSRGSNTAIFEYRLSRWTREARYLIADWGGAMGKWGGTVVSRGRWDVDGFEAQTPLFVTGVIDGWVSFGYQGQRTAEIARNITVADVRWFHAYARQIPEAALREALLECGAESGEASRFAAALRARIDQLGAACGDTIKAA